MHWNFVLPQNQWNVLICLVQQRWEIRCSAVAALSPQNRINICSHCAERSAHTHNTHILILIHKTTNKAPAQGTQSLPVFLCLFIPSSSFPFSPKADADCLWQIALGCCHFISVMYCWWQAWARWAGGLSITSKILRHRGESSRPRMDVSHLSAAPSSGGVSPAGSDHSWDRLSPWAQKTLSVLLEKQSFNLADKKMNRRPNLLIQVYPCWTGIFSAPFAGKEAD